MTTRASTTYTVIPTVPLAGIAELDDTDLASLLNIVDALVAKKRIRAVIDTETG